MLHGVSYADWDLAAKQGLDVFLRRELIGWSDDQVKLAQSARDGTAVSTQALRAERGGQVVRRDFVWSKIVSDSACFCLLTSCILRERGGGAPLLWCFFYLPHGSGFFVNAAFARLGCAHDPCASFLAPVNNEPNPARSDYENYIPLTRRLWKRR